MTAALKFAALSITTLVLAACQPVPGDNPEANNLNNDLDATAETSVQQDVSGEAAVQ